MEETNISNWNAKYNSVTIKLHIWEYERIISPIL